MPSTSIHTVAKDSFCKAESRLLCVHILLFINKHILFMYRFHEEGCDEHGRTCLPLTNSSPFGCEASSVYDWMVL